MQAMIFAAGLGTRLKEETLDKPKALVQIGEKTLLQLAIEKLIHSGVTRIVVNVHHFASLVVNFIENNDFGIPVYISDESEKLLDTGGGLKKAGILFNNSEPVLIYNVDVLCNISLQKVFKAHSSSEALATLVVMNRESDRYLKFDETGRLTGWINKSTGEKKISIPDKFEKSKEKAFSGIHIIDPWIFNLMPEEEVFSVTDLYLSLAKNNFIASYEDSEIFWMDVGKPHQLAIARKLVN